MAIAIFAINKRVVVNEVFVACVVWRIYIDYVDFTCMGICEGGKGFEVVALDKNMIGSIWTGISQCSFFVLD